MCQLWALWFIEIILFDTHSKVHQVDFAIPSTEEETKGHKM